MAAKTLFVFLASALFIQSITAQCAENFGNIGNLESNNIGLINGLATNFGPGIGVAGLGLANLGGNGFAANGFFGNGFGNGNLYGNGNGLVPSSGGAFVVSSYSPIAPSGISVVSENAIDGSLAVSGSLPFLSAIGLEGQVPANGAAGVQYGCGNGNVGIVSENSVPAAGLAGPGLAGPGLAGPGLAGPGLAGPGLAGPGLMGPGLTGLGYGASLANAGLAGAALNGPITRAPCANSNLY